MDDILREDLTVYVGVDYVKFWNYIRPVEESYVSAGHTLTLEATGLTPETLTIHSAVTEPAPGGGHQFVVVAELVLTAAVTGTLTAGTVRDYVITLNDSEARKQVVMTGRIYALKVASLPT